jgi:hypothetical protein
MVNNSTNISTTKKYLFLQIIEQKKNHDMQMESG